MELSGTSRGFCRRLFYCVPNMATWQSRASPWGGCGRIVSNRTYFGSSHFNGTCSALPRWMKTYLKRRELKRMTPKWREVIKIHPAADLFPTLSEEELRELGEDI